jgi:hypothetical protein
MTIVLRYSRNGKGLAVRELRLKRGTFSFGLSRPPESCAGSSVRPSAGRRRTRAGARRRSMPLQEKDRAPKCVAAAPFWSGLCARSWQIAALQIVSDITALRAPANSTGQVRVGDANEMQRGKAIRVQFKACPLRLVADQQSHLSGDGGGSGGGGGVVGGCGY